VRLTRAPKRRAAQASKPPEPKSKLLIHRAAITSAIEGLLTDGGHHKQWFLEAVLTHLGEDVDALARHYGFERGVAP